MRIPLLLALTAVLLGPAAAAQDAAPAPITWAVAPSVAPGGEDRPNFLVDADPGETVSDALVVSNRSAVDLVLGVYASDAFNTADGKIDLLPGDDAPVDVGLWTSVDAPSITVPAGGQVDVPFRITVPIDAAPGDHTGGIVTTLTLTEAAADGTRVRVERRLGSRIYLRVGGELRPSLRFTDVSAHYEGTWNPFAAGSMVVDYTVTNNGNVRLRAEREVSVATGLGLPERTQQAAADMDELLPGNTYRLSQRVRGVWPAFGTDVEVQLRPFDPAASSDVAPGAVVGRFRTSMFPTPQVVALVVLLIAALLVWRSRRRRKRSVQAAIGVAVSKALADQERSPEREPVGAGAPFDPGTPPPWPGT